MALPAFVCLDVSGMRFVALQAFRLFPVDIMTGRAAQCRMLALIFDKLLVLLRMAGQAWFRQFRRKGYD
jgi:hypothetical protein